MPAESTHLAHAIRPLRGSDDEVLALPFTSGYAPDNERQMAVMTRVQEGDCESLQALIDRFWEPLVTFATSFLGYPDDAEDVVQEAFVQVWGHRAEWTPSGSVSAYLYRITRNLALDALRRRHTREKCDKVGGEELFHSTPPATAEEDFEEEVLRQEVEAAILSLPERRREIFRLSRFHGLTHREIAESLGISPQTVSNQMCTALTDLREALRHRLEHR